MTGARPANLQELFAALGKLFTQHEYESRVRAAITNGSLLRDIGSQQIGQFLLRVFAGMSRTDFNAVELARVLSRLDDSIFVVLNISPDSVTVATFEELCQRFQERYDIRTALNQAKTAQRTSGQWRQRGSTPAAATSVPTTTSSSPPATSQATPPRTSQQRPKATSPCPNGQTA
ncbi:hypothetical protein GGH95_000833 [Coemansia sp. RSA 1836]|nr:hypothetical protein GGH95_000833 [Coemansia sp. RSA 1836]